MFNQQTVTITFLRYDGLQDCWWAFRQMGLSGETLGGIAGLKFGKMLGSGGGKGFSLRPNFRVYGLLGVWTNEAAARNFFEGHEFFREIRCRTREIWTVFMRTARVHGQWDKGTPFEIRVPYDENLPVGVLTRATIHRNHLWRFWRFVPAVSRSIEGQNGCLFSIGIGELPIVQQATFSLWENSRRMKAYAYQGDRHREVVRRTRELGWYQEELFARFHPFSSKGSWNGANPLERFILPNDFKMDALPPDQQ